MALGAVALTACSAITSGTGQGAGPEHAKAPTLHQLWKHTVGGEPGTEQPTAPCAIGFKYLAVIDPRGKIIRRVTVPREATELISSPGAALDLLSSSTVYGFG